MALGTRYVKAALSSVGPRARELPTTVAVRASEVDRGHLAGYARICGFALSDTLPPTYPHVLAFPLHVELMAGRSFPLPLPGLVHIANSITVHRRIDAAEPLEARVHAERFVAHPKGAQVDLVAEISASGEPAWSGRSTYLARGATAPDTDRSTVAPAGSAAAGHTDDPTTDGGPWRPTTSDVPVATWRVDAGTGRRYAGVSGDVNPIHLHPLTARAFGFPRAIAHGMWTAARALAALQGRVPDALTYDVEFGRAVLLPSTVELRTRESATGWGLRVDSGSHRHLTARVSRA